MRLASTRNLAIFAALAAALAGCDNRGVQTDATTSAATEAASAPAAVDQSEAINAWFEEQWEAQVARSPQLQTFLGRKTNYGKWDDSSDAFRKETHALLLASLDDMRRKFRFENLDENAQLSYRLYEYQVELADTLFPYRNHNYHFHHFRAPHSSIPSFLINQHKVDTVADAEAYIERLNGVTAYLAAHQENAEAQFAAGIHAPLWSIEKMIATSRNVISGAPFDDGDPSVLYTDFRDKMAALDIDEELRNDLLARAADALRNSVEPAYQALIAMFERQRETASNDDGVWKLPDGANYYAARLEQMTTTMLSAEEIHALGLSEVARIHGEMSKIKNAVGFEGPLREFFTYMRTDPDGRFAFSNDNAGREEYLAAATAAIDAMRERLDDLFYTKPKAELVVKRVEPFREQSAGKAFYQRPAPGGARPGVYYANLYDMDNMPTYQLEALAFHEGIPGHHMQIAISQELENVPSFRRFGSVTAFSEGWGLYSEYIPKEMGFYADPYADFGRLAMELWRAARLVVDTGIHDKKWTREEAIAYLVENTPNPEGDCINAIERYVVMPGQATAYKIGMLKILELRERAEDELGEAFDIRAFHDAVLKNGPVPLSILEDNINRWISETKAA